MGEGKQIRTGGWRHKRARRASRQHANRRPRLRSGARGAGLTRTHTHRRRESIGGAKRTRRLAKGTRKAAHRARQAAGDGREGGAGRGG